eukprot:gene4861-6812_t
MRVQLLQTFLKGGSNKYSFRLCSTGLSPTLTAEYLQTINMPVIMDVKVGTVDKWLKKEGEEFQKGDELCEVSLSDFSIAIDAPSYGIMAKILVKNRGEVNANDPIAVYAQTKDSYMTYLDSVRISSDEEENIAELKEINEEKSKPLDKMTLLKEIKNLIHEGKIDGDSDFARQLQSQARKGNKDLMDIFVASFDGSTYNINTFDEDFFIDNAQGLINEIKEIK